jgi:hypothetical protein
MQQQKRTDKNHTDQKQKQHVLPPSQPNSTSDIPEHIKIFPHSVITLWLSLDSIDAETLRKDIESIGQFVKDAGATFNNDPSALYMMGPPENCPACGKKK